MFQYQKELILPILTAEELQQTLSGFAAFYPTTAVKFIEYRERERLPWQSSELHPGVQIQYDEFNHTVRLYFDGVMLELHNDVKSELEVEDIVADFEERIYGHD